MKHDLGAVVQLVHIDSGRLVATLSPMQVLAPAKLNLFLRVGPRDAGGFHPLQTWMVTAGLFDRLIIQRSADNALVLTCNDSSLAADRSNLVLRAAEALLQSPESRPGQRGRGEVAGADASIPDGVRIDLHKSIPHGAGLGGGSSDAARTLLALNRLLGLNHSRDQLTRIAASIGSDVPFFLHGPSSICTGRGEVVQPIAPPAAKWALLALPAMALATPRVYQRFDELTAVERAGWQEDRLDWQELVHLPAAQLLPRLVNDLEPAALDLRPELAHLRQQIERIAHRPVRMSGSGSSLFTLFDEEASARAAAEQVERDLATRARAVEIAPQIHDALNDPARE